MPRYLIERTYTVDMDGLPTVATRSKAIGHHHYPEIVWEHSHVVRRHRRDPEVVLHLRRAERGDGPRARQIGSATTSCTTIYEIAGDVSPDDFPLTDDPA